MFQNVPHACNYLSKCENNYVTKSNIVNNQIKRVLDRVTVMNKKQKNYTNGYIFAYISTGFCRKTQHKLTGIWCTNDVHASLCFTNL